MIGDKLVIGFAGLKQSGKTTAANTLQGLFPYYVDITSFAFYLKKIVKELFLFSDEQMTDPVLKEVVDLRWGKSPRQIMQLFATDFVRNMVMRDFWVQRTKMWIETESKSPIVILDDLRFSEEVEICDYVFMVHRKGLELVDDHESENPPYHLAYSDLINDYDRAEDYRRYIAGSLVTRIIQERINGRV